MGTTRTKVTEYEFDENGRIVKEIETITENEIPPFKFDSLWKNQQPKFHPYFGGDFYVTNLPKSGRTILDGGYL